MSSQVTLSDFNLNQTHNSQGLKEEISQGIPLPKVIEDIQGGLYYPFKIKPEDEDEQTFYPPRRKNGRWGMMAFCFMATSSTSDLIHRLQTRTNYQSIIAQREAL